MEKNVNGLVKSINRITSAFNSFRFVTVFSIVGAFATAVLCVYYTTTKLAECQTKIYVLDNGRTFSATMQDAAINREDEIKDQVTTFHNLFFNVPPDMSMIKRNLELALNLSDKSAYKYFEDLNESGYYKKMVNADAYQQIQVNEVSVDMSVYPYQITTKCTQWITRDSNMSKYSLITHCIAVNIPRSQKNLHGLMLQKFEVIENNQLETRKR